MGLFESESELVDSFCSELNAEESPWAVVAHAREFGYGRGCTDVIALSAADRLIAFEAKLTRWRDALDQAYKSTSFAHQSFVLLPEETATRAAEYAQEFKRRSVGLCFISLQGLVVLIQAVDQQPIQPWLSEKARSRITGGEQCSENHTSSSTKSLD